MREQTPVHAYNDGCDCCERFGQDPSTCKDRFCDLCDGPCRGVRWEGGDIGQPVTAQESEAMAKLERDQLISGAAGYMASAGAFAEKFKRNGPLTQDKIDAAVKEFERNADRVTDFLCPPRRVYDDVREDFSHCSPPSFKLPPGDGNIIPGIRDSDARAAFVDLARRDGPNITRIYNGATPAEGRGDTVIPINKNRRVDTRFDTTRWCPTGKLKHIEPMPPATPKVVPWSPELVPYDPELFKIPIDRPSGRITHTGLRGGQAFFDGSIPPGISTDPFKDPVDAMPNTPLQRVREATIKVITAGLELNDALEALDNYQTLTGKAA